MALTQFLNERLIKLNLIANNKIDVITELVDLMHSSGEIEDKELFLESVIEREGMGSTGIGHGVAIPHGRADVAKRLIIAFGRSPEGIEFDAIDNQKVNLFFMLAPPKGDMGLYLKALAELARLLNQEEFRKALVNARSPEEVIAIIDKFEKEPG